MILMRLKVYLAMTFCHWLVMWLIKQFPGKGKRTLSLKAINPFIWGLLWRMLTSSLSNLLRPLRSRPLLWLALAGSWLFPKANLWSVQISEPFEMVLSTSCLFRWDLCIFCRRVELNNLVCLFGWWIHSSLPKFCPYKSRSEWCLPRREFVKVRRTFQDWPGT